MGRLGCPLQGQLGGDVISACVLGELDESTQQAPFQK
jgi:hypothetical protein